MFTITHIASRQDIDEIHKKEAGNVSLPERLCNYERSGHFKDVHQWDGKVDEIPLEKISIEESQKIIAHLASLLKNGNAINMLKIIFHRNNFDPANRVDSTDLLVWICTHKITTELFYMLEEQLSDNGILGTCLQGSSHRIRQIYYAQKDIQETENQKLEN